MSGTQFLILVFVIIILILTGCLEGYREDIRRLEIKRRKFERDYYRGTPIRRTDK